MTLPHSPSHSGLTIDDSIECLPLTEEQFEGLLGGGNTLDYDYNYDYDYDGRTPDEEGQETQGYGESVSDGPTNYPTSLADAVVKLCQADYWEVKPTTTPQPATTPMPTPPSPPLPPSCADETERLRQVFCFGPVYGPPHVPLL